MHVRVTLALGLCALMIVSSLGISQAATPDTRKSQLALFDSHIDHIVFLMQENHAFDSIYGEYCPVVGTYCWSTADGVPNKCELLNPLNASQGCVTPYNFTAAQVAPPDMEHDWYSTHSAWNYGAMNNFYAAEGTKETFGHYNGSTVPFYWDLAEQYGLGDDFFSSDASYSLPNHWDEYASTPPNESQIPYIGTNVAQDMIYLNQANRTPSVEDDLVNSTLAWKVYDYILPSYNNSIASYNTFNYWNPLAARAASYQATVRTHFGQQSGFFNDVAAGRLPNLSWVIPTPADSDHPAASITTGQQWVASVVDAIEASPEWNTTVLFITWDEYGGFFDQVAPPYQDAYGDGFRVPLLAIGPWVRQGFIDHQQMDYGSILHLMEERFGLACIGPRDCNAKLPLGMFNFSRTSPRAPIGFATNATWKYPMPLQSGGTLPYYSPAEPPQGDIDATPAPAFDVLDWG